MHPDEAEERLLNQQMDDLCEVLREGIDREVARLRREGLPIYVEVDWRIIELQTNQSAE